MTIKISAVITCFNNESTIEKCVSSLLFADEIIVLDSNSTDQTLDLLKQFNCTVHKQKFKGFSQQKQDAINLASHDWVLMLDSDEFFDGDAQKTIIEWQKSKPMADAYKLPRLEWAFWKWSHQMVHKTSFVRLFNRKQAKVTKALVHESIKSTGKTESLHALIKHFSEINITTKVDKLNQYSQLMAQQRFNNGKKVHPIKILIYPMWYFIRQYIFRRQFVNGFAGLIVSYLDSKYAFMKYAKLYELQKKKELDL